MPIDNQKFDISGKYQYQIGIWYLCPNFLGVFEKNNSRCLSMGLISSGVSSQLGL